eukprot:126566-Chlamydomonas_euryale.AAC.1
MRECSTRARQRAEEAASADSRGGNRAGAPCCKSRKAVQRESQIASGKGRVAQREPRGRSRVEGVAWKESR